MCGSGEVCRGRRREGRCVRGGEVCRGRVLGCLYCRSSAHFSWHYESTGGEQLKELVINDNAHILREYRYTFSLFIMVL